MKRFTENKIFLGFVVFMTLALAGVAVFTAVKLYQARQTSLAPTSPKTSYAFECTDYDVTIDTEGTVKIVNNSSSPQPAQDIDLIVDGESIGSFTVPALSPEEDAILGGIGLDPGEYDFSIDGLTACQQLGETVQDLTSCNEVALVLAAGDENEQVTPTPSPTGTIQEPTPTDLPDPTATPTAAVTATPTQSAALTSPTPTPQMPPTPDSGVSLPTVAFAVLGMLIVIGSLLLIF